MHSKSHKWIAFCLSVFLIGSFAAVPVAGLVGAAYGSLSGLSAPGLLGLNQPLQLVDNAGLRSFAASPNTAVELILQLQGRSLAQEQVYRQSLGLPPLDAAGQRAYVAAVGAAQAPIVAALRAAGATVRYQYHFAYNGIDAVGPRGMLAAVIPQLPNVARVDLAQNDNLLLDASVPFIFDGASYSDLGADGTGITIALIDTGIDYTHAAFGGPGTPAAYAAVNPTTLAGSGFPTPKVIGGFDLVGEKYDARGATAPGGLCTNVPHPDPNPLDINGHGTHTADTAAGMEVLDSHGNMLTPHGVAPGALVYEFKVFSGCAADGTASTDNSNVIAAIEMALDPNGDGDTSDHANIISMSLGSDFGRDTTPDSVAANAAVDLGAIVVASAGNAGHFAYIEGSPGAASKVISVAAGNDPKIHIQFVEVAGTAGGAADGNKVAVEAAITPLLATTGTKTGRTANGGLGCTAYPAGTFTNMIPLISRGTCTFAEKILNAQAAGAIAVVVFDNRLEDPIVMGGSSAGITIPAVMISQADGNAILAALTSTTTLKLDPANIEPIPNRLAPFTSGGPRFGDSALKPDLTAPGVEILSALVGTGTGASPVSGTSFSAPHIAGVAAILRELHPTWSVEEIKDVMMNTATDASPDNTNPYGVSLMGAGRVRVDVAAKATSVAVPGSLSFGVVESTAAGPTTYGQSLDVRNKAGPAKTFDVTAVLVFNRDTNGGVTMSFPASLSVPMGGDASFTFSLTVDFSKIARGTFREYAGFVTLTDTSGPDVLRVPFEIIPIARASASATGPSGGMISVSNPGVANTTVDLFQLGVTSHHANPLPGEDGDWLTIKATGARTYGTMATSSHPDQILEFGVATWGLRSAPSDVVTDIIISVDGVPAYDVEIADLGLLTTGSVNGQMVSAVFALQPAKTASVTGFLEFLVNSDKNTAWQKAPILLGDLNVLARENHLPKIGTDNHAFTYTVVMTDMQTGFFDFAGPGTFNAKMPAVGAVPNSFVVPAGGSATAQVVGSGSLLAIFENNVAGPVQSAVISA